MPLNTIITITGKAVPVPGADMDTDRIIPSRFLKCITFDELAGTMFYDERFNTDGSTKHHPIDDPAHAGACIIFGGENFGCGSSREHAPQAIKRSGIQAIVAESFAEIFIGNSSGIGLPCVCAAHTDLEAAIELARREPDTQWTVNLENLTLSCAKASYPITMQANFREALIRGRWDAVVELMNAPETVAKLAASLPAPSLS